MHATPDNMPRPITKAHQQDIVADFIYAREIPLCMYVYLNAFLDMHYAKFPATIDKWGKRGVMALLETSWKRIHDDLQMKGLLTEEAAGNYMMNRGK